MQQRGPPRHPGRLSGSSSSRPRRGRPRRRRRCPGNSWRLCPRPGRAGDSVLPRARPGPGSLRRHKPKRWLLRGRLGRLRCGSVQPTPVSGGACRTSRSWVCSSSGPSRAGPCRSAVGGLLGSNKGRRADRNHHRTSRSPSQSTRPARRRRGTPGQPARSRRNRNDLRRVGPETENWGRGGRRTASSHGLVAARTCPSSLPCRTRRRFLFNAQRCSEP